ncbi:DUF6680 family protein [Acidisphaera sp. S103]|uniref:DUF6680 family protein n=1 Tax=Acidisphaera sp. S103 TaxID=1747223 RepID=UPI00131C97EA|nr:DUF6680 family protein [Acidisphaera sp. S103]
MIISDVLLILATFCGPIAAVQSQKWIERAREQRARRLSIFETLMATRAIRAGSNEHVQALNLIEVFFNGKSAKEKAVRDAWLIYLDFFNQHVPVGEDNARAHNEKGVDFLVTLLEAIAKTLGYDFNKVQLKRGGYYPRGHAEEKSAHAAIRDNLVRVLTGVQPVNMAVVSLPVSEESLKNQKLLQEALLKTLSGD